MDLKHMLAQNPLRPVYRSDAGVARAEGGESAAAREAPTLRWVDIEGGLREIGHAGDGFHFDNEAPRHRVWLDPFQLASRLVTNGEYLAFIEDGGYQRPEFWLSLGWATVQAQGWQAPLYWEKHDKSGDWQEFTLGGRRPLDPRQPVVHVSYMEADAFARWAGARLPTEAEWEVVAAEVPVTGNFVEQRRYHPEVAPRTETGLSQMFGDVWEWTRSAYSPYPRYAPPAGAIGEYNGKFMCNQYVLRGGCCATAGDHIRRTYRNFFPPDRRWAFGGIRLARDVC